MSRKFERLELWRLPLDFFDVDDETRFKMLAAVTSPALPRDSHRDPPPMSALQQAAALLICSLVALPLLILCSFGTLLFLGHHRAAGLVLATTLFLALHPLPWGRLACKLRPTYCALA